MNEKLTALDSHFAFGENWADYAKGIGEAQIVEAEAGLRRLLGGGDLAGKRFLDIGCGSGLHSLAALNLGASEVLAVDIDPDSVATTQAVLKRFAEGKRFTAKQTSAFDLDPAHIGKFDVVYSWGVLHHTGNMDGAVRKAAGMVGEGGLFVFALYRRTLMCPFWKVEKRWYSGASAGKQKIARGTYTFLFRLGLLATGRGMSQYVAGYKTRGMDFSHDVHDWLGGYPYESILPEEIEALMGRTGFARVRSFLVSPKRRLRGLFGSGCDEYVYRRI